MNPSGESARINGADVHTAGHAVCVPNGCGDCGGSLSVTCPALKEQWTREDAKAAARLNAETLVGMQTALREAEDRAAALKVALTDLLTYISDEEGNREEVLFAEDNCHGCTAGTALTYTYPGTGMRAPKLCPRHRATRLLGLL